MADSTASEEPQHETSLAFLPLATSKKFPFKCHEMLQYAEKRGLDDIVSWLPGGKGFRVHDHEPFCKKVLKATFNHSNYKSFEKQLNNWGFQRDATGKGRAYSNPNFVRGRKSLCQAMTSKSTRTRGKPSESENQVTRMIPADSGRGTTPNTTSSTLAAALIAAQANSATQLGLSSVSATSPLGPRSTLLKAQALMAAAAAAAASTASTPAAMGNTATGITSAELSNAIRNHQAATAQQQLKDRALIAALTASIKSQPSLSAAEIEMVLGQRRLRLQQQQALLDQIGARQDEMVLRRLLEAQDRKTALLRLARAVREEEHDRAAALLSLRNTAVPIANQASTSLSR